MDVYQPDRKHRGRARQRVAARQHRKMATPRAPEAGTPLETRTPLARRNVSIPSFRAPRTPAHARLSGAISRASILVRDVFWHVRNDTRILLGIAGAVLLVCVVYVLIHVSQNRIFPNVWSLGVALGGKNIDEAAAALQQSWDRDIQIQLVDGERQWELAPAELGIRLDARATAESAQRVGLSGLPFGYNVLPAVELDVLRAQNTLLDYTEITKIVPYNAGYRWEGDQLVGVPGSDGRFLDVAVTMEDLGENLTQVANQRRLDLVMTPMEPDIFDPAPYLEQARALTSQTFLLRAYDPFTNQTVAWTPDRDSFTSWLEAGVDSLSLREEDFAEYVDTQTATLSQQNPLLYIEPSDAIEKVRQAITEGRAQVTLRVRYRTSTYTVQPGDSGYRIARRTGVPFFLLQQANPNRDWDVLLSVGETVNLPSRDEVVPLDPVPNKRIIVDLETQTLYAYENGQLVFNWLISSGMDQAPTSPGVYQILSHDDMGIYEIVPGLVNGFHGAVDLPGGRIMGDGNVGRPYTYGCVMSVDGNAEQLYRWADEGTIVEIVSSEYPPQSDLGRLALGQPTQAQNSTSSSL
jgi:LysM repeat protein